MRVAVGSLLGEQSQRRILSDPYDPGINGPSGIPFIEKYLMGGMTPGLRTTRLNDPRRCVAAGGTPARITNDRSESSVFGRESSLRSC